MNYDRREGGKKGESKVEGNRMESLQDRLMEPAKEQQSSQLQEQWNLQGTKVTYSYTSRKEFGVTQ